MGAPGAPELLARWPDIVVRACRNVSRLWTTRFAIGYRPAVVIAGTALSWIVLIEGLAGMWLARRSWRRLAPLYLTIAVVTAMYMPYTSEARYTLPTRGAMIVFVTYARHEGKIFLARVLLR